MPAGHRAGWYSEREGGGMPTISNDEVEAEARAVLRDQLMRLPWFPERLRRQEDLC